MRLLNGYRVTQAIHVAATLGIADLLKDGPRFADDLAAATGSHPGALYRVLRALAAVGVFREEADRRFSLAPMGRCLCSDAERPVGPYAAFVGRPHHWQAWGDLLHSTLTGENAFRHVHGVGVWDYLANNPEEGAIFDRAMTGNSRGIAERIMSAYDFSPFGRVVDVAGGQGALLAAILAAHQTMSGILFDRPEVVARARPVLEAARVTERCEVVGGSFFEAVPEGGDAYLLKYILHDWDDAASFSILRACRRACGPNAKLLVMERVVAPPNEGTETKISDLNMLVSPGGKERTGKEFVALLASAGFRMERIVEVDARLSVIEGVAV
jgi:ubiquinone/menaquinone biosynthesis C-methylase UbiE